MRLRDIMRFTHRKHISLVTKESWDATYASGRWDYLRTVDEMERYSTIVAYCHVLGGGLTDHLSILDVGCGEGILLELLNPQSYVRYVGVDISDVAIQRARPKGNAKTVFASEDVESYVPNENFSTIVYNECLYYLRDPLALMKRHEAILKPNGVFIVSMYFTKKSQAIWKLIDKEYSIVDEARIDGHQCSWRIKALQIEKADNVESRS